MDNDKYYQAFMNLNIPIVSLPANYTPEEFGRRLYALSQKEKGVSYAASTDYSSFQQNSVKTPREKK
ncbi:MAG: hypothetical protein IJH91_00150 [Mogibacterium sp.]|nr:hypothetical protein [Mogibacterium sp.]